MPEETVPVIYAPSGERLPLTPENVAKVLLQTAQCPCVATDPVKKQKCKELTMDMKAAIEDEIKAMGEYHIYSDRFKEVGFDPIFSEIMVSIRNDEREHKDMLESVLKALDNTCK